MDSLSSVLDDADRAEAPCGPLTTYDLWRIADLMRQMRDRFRGGDVVQADPSDTAVDRYIADLEVRLRQLRAAVPEIQSKYERHETLRMTSVVMERDGMPGVEAAKASCAEAGRAIRQLERSVPM